MIDNDNDIVKRYQQCKSIKKTARELSISESAVRKTLITAEAYTTPLIREIKKHADNGLSDADIGKILGKSAKVINANRAYTNGTHKPKMPLLIF